MKVKLISTTNNLLDVLYTGARTCYNAGSPLDMWADVYTIPTDKKLSLINKVLDSGHFSVAEHINFTFAIEGISRACSHQLVRHRHCSFSQQSQRYVEIKEDLEELTYLYSASKEAQLMSILEKYFVNGASDNWFYYYTALRNYLELIGKGAKPEDARQVLPNDTKTNMVLTCNLRELVHIANERLCTRAQREVRGLLTCMCVEVIRQYDWLEKYLQPKCERLGYCPEAKGCGRKKGRNA